MNTRSFLAALLLALAFAITGCQRITEADKVAAVDVVKQNLAAMQTKNLDAMIATIHSQSPHFEQTKMITQRIFQLYEINYSLKSAEVESATPDAIRVRFEQVMVRMKGPEDFKSNRVSGIHILRRDGSQWKLWSSEGQKITLLEEE